MNLEHTEGRAHKESSGVYAEIAADVWSRPTDTFPIREAEMSSRLPLQDYIDFSDPLLVAQSPLEKMNRADRWLGDCRNGRRLGTDKIAVNSLGASKEFTDQIDQAIDGLPPKLREALDGYTITVSQLPDRFIEDGYNHEGKAIKKVDDRNNVREHAAVTVAEQAIQNFNEWYYNPAAGRTVHWSESNNLRGTVFHEASHALDAKLGYPSESDQTFDSLYRQDVAELTRSGEDLGAAAMFVDIDPVTGKAGTVGKAELFADLGAALRCGEPSSKFVTREILIASFPRTAQYFNQKLLQGEW